MNKITEKRSSIATEFISLHKRSIRDNFICRDDPLGVYHNLVGGTYGEITISNGKKGVESCGVIEIPGGDCEDGNPFLFEFIVPGDSNPKFSAEKQYMNLETGSVDSEAGWIYKDESGVDRNPVTEGSVKEVVKNNSGEWELS